MDDRYRLLVLFCQDPNRRTTSPEENNIKNKAKTNYFVRDGKLFIRRNNKETLLSIRDFELYGIIVEAHCVLPGHAGITKTYQRLQQKFYGIKR